MQIQTKYPKYPRAASSELNQRIYRFLYDHPSGVLATVDPNGSPHSAVIYFTVDKDFKIMFTTKARTKKYNNLVHNNHVMLVVYEPQSQTTVQITGRSKEISETLEAQQAFKDMLRVAQGTSESGEPPISKLFAGYYVAFRIDPVQIRMAIFARPDPGGYDIYETLNF